MNCYYHPDREAVRRCDKCGQLMCQECPVDVDGRIVCKSCLSIALETAPSKRAHARSSNLLLVFLLAMLPGAAHMYMGLMKRGMLILSAFFLSIWVMSETMVDSFWPVLVLVIIASFFDALNTRKRIVNGDYVEDTVADITGFFKRFRIPVLIFTAYILFTSFAGYGRLHAPFSQVYMNVPRVDFGPILAIGAFIFVFYTLTGKKKRKHSTGETIDVRGGQDGPY